MPRWLARRRLLLPRRPHPHSLWARLQGWDSMLLSLSLALHCSPIFLEPLPLARLRAMASELAQRHRNPGTRR